MVKRDFTSRMPDVPIGETNATARFPLGEHRLTLQRSSGHVRAHIDLEVPEGVRVLRSPAGDPPDSEAGDLLLAIPEIARALDPRFGVQVDVQGISVWEIGAPDRLNEVAAAAEAMALALDPWLVADPKAPWSSLLSVGLADLTPTVDEQGGRARIRLQQSPPDLVAELRLTPVSEERFEVEVEAELEDGAVETSLRLGEAAWPFAFADQVLCADPVVDEAFTVRSKSGAALMRTIAPHLRGYLDFGGGGFDLEIEPRRLAAHALLPRTMVPRWVWTLADVWRIGGLGFHRVGDEEGPPARRWFGALPGREPTGVLVEIGGQRTGTWSRAADALAREVRASTVDESRVFRGQYDVVGQLGDHDLVCSLRAPGEALFLSTCAAPWTFKYTHDPGFDEGDLTEVAALFQHWRRTDARFHLSATRGHGDLDGPGPGVYVLRAWMQGIQPRDLSGVWRALESLIRLKDPDAERRSTDLFLDVVRGSPMKLGPDGVELGHRSGRLFWGEPWHTLHETRLTLRAKCRTALHDLDISFGLSGEPVVFTGPAYFGDKLAHAYKKLQKAQGRTQPTFSLKRSGGELVCYVRANRATLPVAVDAVADFWSAAGG